MLHARNAYVPAVVELDLEFSDGEGAQDLGRHTQHLGVRHHQPCATTKTKEDAKQLARKLWAYCTARHFVEPIEGAANLQIHTLYAHVMSRNQAHARQVEPSQGYVLLLWRRRNSWLQYLVANLVFHSGVTLNQRKRRRRTNAETLVFSVHQYPNTATLTQQPQHHATSGPISSGTV